MIRMMRVSNLSSAIGIAAAAVLLAGLPGCERAAPGSGSSESTSTSGGSAGAETATGDSFKLPSPDTSGWPPPVRSAFDEGRAQFRINPKDANQLVSIGALMYVHGSAADAAACFRRAAELIPDHEAGHYYLGMALEKAGQIDAAVTAYEESAKHNPEAAQPWARVALALQARDQQRATAALEKWVTLQPNDARAHLGLARIARATGNNEEALRHVQQAIKLFPSYIEAHKEAAEVSKALGKADDAERHGKLAAGAGRTPPIIDPLYAKLLEAGMDLNYMIQLARQETEVRDFAAAETRLLSAMAMDPSGAARAAMGLLRLREGKSDEAMSMARSLLESSPNSAPANALMGEVLWQQRKFEEAQASFTKAISIDPVDARSRYLLGLILLRAGKLDAAKAEFTSVTELIPHSSEAYEALVEIANRGKNPGEAERVMRLGIERNPANSKLCNALAWSLATSADAARRNGREAVELARRACEAVEFGMHEYLDTLAAAFAEAGDFENARKAIEDALRLAREAAPATPAEKDALTRNIAEYESRQKLFAEGKPYHAAH